MRKSDCSSVRCFLQQRLSWVRARATDHFMTGSEDGTVRQFDLREAPSDSSRDDPHDAAVIGALLISHSPGLSACCARSAAPLRFPLAFFSRAWDRPRHS